MNSLRSLVNGTRLGILIVLLLGLFAGVAFSHTDDTRRTTTTVTINTPEGGWVGESDPHRWDADINGYEWSDTLAALYPECHKFVENTMTTSVLVIDARSGKARVIPTCRAWKIAYTPRLAKRHLMWVVGQCGVPA